MNSCIRNLSHFVSALDALPIVSVRVRVRAMIRIMVKGGARDWVWVKYIT
jgi:hypothetical protein